MTSPFEPEQESILKACAKRYPHRAMGLLEALRRVQGWHLRVTDADEEYLSGLFEAPRVRIHELATFFPTFTQEPVGRHRIGLCRGLSCSLGGGEEMCRCLERKLGVRAGEVTPDGRFSFEQTECLGACDQAPAILVDWQLHGNVGPENLETILALYP